MDTLVGMYENGYGGFQQDSTKAKFLYENACRNQFDWAETSPCYYLGYLYMEGLHGFSRDKKKAEFWWRKYIAIPPDGEKKLHESGYTWPIK